MLSSITSGRSAMELIPSEAPTTTATSTTTPIKSEYPTYVPGATGYQPPYIAGGGNIQAQRALVNFFRGRRRGVTGRPRGRPKGTPNEHRGQARYTYALKAPRRMGIRKSNRWQQYAGGINARTTGEAFMGRTRKSIMGLPDRTLYIRRPTKYVNPKTGRVKYRIVQYKRSVIGRQMAAGTYIPKGKTQPMLWMGGKARTIR